MLRYAAAAVTSLVLLTGITACGGDDPPPPKADPSRTPTTPAASHSPSPPAMPAAAKANSKAGAKAFVRHYIAAFNYAERTGDTRVLQDLEGQHCESCQNVRKSIDRIYASGGHVKGGRWIVRSLQPLPRTSKSWEVDVLGEFQPSTVYPGDSATARHAKGGDAPSSFFVHFNRTWRVTEWTRGI